MRYEERARPPQNGKQGKSKGAYAEAAGVVRQCRDLGAGAYLGWHRTRRWRRWERLQMERGRGGEGGLEDGTDRKLRGASARMGTRRILRACIDCGCVCATLVALAHKSRQQAKHIAHLLKLPRVGRARCVASQNAEQGSKGTYAGGAGAVR